LDGEEFECQVDVSHICCNIFTKHACSLFRARNCNCNES
jgi:hypothetical protein